MTELRLARVLRYPPGQDSADLQFLDDGWKAPNCPIMLISGSSNTGVHDLPELVDGRKVIAVCGSLRGYPVVIGFVLPSEQHETVFADTGKKVSRHGSDVYSTIDSDGSIELAHPSGTYIRIAEDPAHVDLTGTDQYKSWTIRRNTDKRVSLQILIGNAAGAQTSLLLDPDGNVTMKGNGDLEMDFANVRINATDTAIIGARNIIQEGEVIVTGAVTSKTDVRVGPVSLANLVVTGVTSGSQASGIPVGGGPEAGAADNPAVVGTGSYKPSSDSPITQSLIDEIHAAEIANGIPTDLLVRQLYQESRFNPNAVNASSGAAGIASNHPGNLT